MSMGITRCAAAVCAVMLLTGDANARVEPTGFRIMSFNTHHGETMDKVIDLRKAGEVVNAERPRFAGLQEVDRRTSRIGRQDACDVLAKMTGMHATFAKAISLGGGEYGNALLSREEPLAVRRIPLPGKEPRVLLLCEFADCWVGVTHLAVDSEEARLGSISAIRAAVSDCGSKPVFLMGDWNASPTSKVLAGLREFLTVLSDESGATFHGGRSEPEALDDPDGCIDYIAVDSAHCGDYAVRARRTVRDLRTSDHLPIVVEVAPPDMAFVELTAPATVRIDDAPAEGAVSIGADGWIRVKHETPFSRIALTWNSNLGVGTKVLGGEWERTYGDSEWHSLAQPESERPRKGAMPWYFLATDGVRTDGYGVETQPNAFASWHVTTGGVSLVLDCRAGSNPVRLGARTLEACRLVSRRGKPGESAFAAGRAFCRLMCPSPRLPSEPVYGYNDWYCAYGRNTATNFLADAAFVCSLVKGEKVRPFLVVDDGWQRGTGRSKAEGAGRRWTGVNRSWGMSMDEVARRIKAMDAHPGLWYRPFLPDVGGRALPVDPTDPALPVRMRDELGRFVAWGYELVKIDFITYDWCGTWGFEHGDSPVVRCLPKWRDETRTTAEVVKGLYAAMREAVGDEVHIIGCNAIDHFAAGLFDLQRTGDDTSGRDWSRTRKMGPNTLGARSIHNDAFYRVDADCFGLAEAGKVPWELNAQWLDLVAASGTALFISWRRQLTTPESRDAIKRALRRAAKPQPTGEPLDWLETPRPAHWRFGSETRTFNWDLRVD